MRISQKLLAVISLFGIMLVGGGSLPAQNRTCTGTVTDAQGEPVIAASVLIKGAPVSTGVVTDIDGRFVQPNAKVGDVLVLSCIGYATTEVTWNGQPLTIVMADDQNLLDETVITAYGGKTLRSKLTNSISTVKNETIASGMHAQAAASLAGAVAGLAVYQTSGSPYAEPTIILRGGTEYSGMGSPLVIVDGAQRSMADVNPNDIESIEVLKDAGATAIYGARAANGVILVTTKRGQEGTSSISFRAKSSLSFFKSQYEYLNSEDYLYWQRTALKNSSWAPDYFTAVQPMGTGNSYFDSYGNVAAGTSGAAALWGVYKYSDELAFLLDSSDWGVMTDPVSDPKNPERIIFWQGPAVKDINIVSPALSQDYTVDFRGGNDKATYYSSIGYNKSNGIARDNDYDRLTFVLNADYKLRTWLTSSHTNRTPLKFNSEAQYFARAFTVPPTMRTYDQYGNYNPSARNSASDGPVGLINDKIDYQDQYDKFNMSQNFTITFTPWLNLRVGASWFYQDRGYEYFEHDYMYGTGSTVIDGVTTPGRWSISRISRNYYSRNLNQTYQAVLNFNKQFGLHSVSAMAGTEFVDQATTGFNAYGEGAPTDEFQDLELTTTAEDKRDIDSWHTYTRVLSYFGKADYDFDGKYLFSGVLRADGYSRLAPASRWGIFPGVSAGWVFTKEDFFAPLRDTFSFGKFRMSYGANGVLPSSIGAYTVQGLYSSGTQYNGEKTTYISTLPLESLRWERSWTFETGLDVGLWENRLNVNVSYYDRHTKDKVSTIAIPNHNGVSGLTSNLGEFRNQGVELELNARLVNTRDWKVTLGFNAAYNKNKIIKLPDNENENNRNGGSQVYVPGSYDPVNGDPDTNYSELMWVGGWQEGQTPGDVYGFKYGGIYGSWAEIEEKANYLKDISSGNNGSNSKPLYGPGLWATLSDDEKKNGYPISPGDAIWEDVNGDGIIDNYDKVKLGNVFPKWTGGFNLSASWRGISLRGRFDYALKYLKVDNITPWIMGNMQGTYNTVSLVKDSFVYDAESDSGTGRYPTYVYADQLGHRNYARANNPIFAYDASYLSIREVTLSYSFPKSLLDKIHLPGASIYVTGQNLGYITAAKNLATPEFKYDSTNGYQTSAYGDGYPLPRILMFGLNLNF